MLDLHSFRVSKELGFLPQEPPLTRLPQDYYQPWEKLVHELPSLLLTRTIRSHVDSLPLLSTEHLEGVRQVRRAYQVLGFLAHAYVWGTDVPSAKLPELVAQPLIDTASQLGLPPLATYAGLCLWNYKPIFDKGEAFPSEDNLMTINTFTGSIDESWFYLVSAIFEHHGAKAVRFGTDAMEFAEAGNVESLVGALQCLAETIDHLGSVLFRMEEMCDPHVFYFRIRPYLAGWQNMSEVGLEGGVVYGAEKAPRAYAGGSNAQLSLIQFLDSVLSIPHRLTGQRPTAGENKAQASGNPYLLQMRDYMPKEHRDFLYAADQSQIRLFVCEQNNPELVLAYDACVAMVKAFRDKHIQLVTRYVVLQAKKVPTMGSLGTLRSGLAKKKKADAEERGTGGTSLLPFLKQCRDETGDAATGSWGKRILTDGVMRLKYSKPSGVNED